MSKRKRTTPISSSSSRKKYGSGIDPLSLEEPGHVVQERELSNTPRNCGRKTTSKVGSVRGSIRP